MRYIHEFPQDVNLTYLNHAGVSPWPLRTARAVEAFAEENVTRGSLHYARWLDVESRLRSQLRSLIHASSDDDIALLKNTSEALSAVAYGIQWNHGDNVVSSAEEFPSNRVVWQSLAHKGVEFREASLSGGVNPEDALISLVDSRTRLITVSSVQFATGLRMDLAHLGEFCRRNGVLFCVDAIQSIGAVSFDVEEIEADFVMADGHKWMLGPEGLALFYCRPAARDMLSLTQYGWHMVEKAGDYEAREWDIAKTARRFECGSPNMLGIHALSASLSLLLEIGMDEVENKVKSLSNYLVERILSEPGLDLVTPSDPARRAGIVTFRMRDGDSQGLYRFLGMNGVVCAFRAGGIRFSPHFYNSQEQLDRALELVLRYLHARPASP
ncbi:MAG: aminotransferase class V-fold PLP-dependent enzyme [Chloroflexota bacterium]